MSRPKKRRPTAPPAPPPSLLPPPFPEWASPRRAAPESCDQPRPPSLPGVLVVVLLPEAPLNGPGSNPCHEISFRVSTSGLGSSLPSPAPAPAPMCALAPPPDSLARCAGAAKASPPCAIPCASPTPPPAPLPGAAPGTPVLSSPSSTSGVSGRPRVYGAPGLRPEPWAAFKATAVWNCELREAAPACSKCISCWWYS